MVGRRRRHAMPLNGEINVVSLIDVMMLLMVIFMITAPIMQGGTEVELPQGPARPLEASNGMTVTVRADGQITVDDMAATNYPTFKASFKAITQNRPRDAVYFKADRNVPWQSVARILAVIREAGVKNASIIMQPEG
jgi:biopolymer transport protein TolR